MKKSSKTYLVQFSNLVEGKFQQGISNEYLLEIIAWFLEEHRAFVKLNADEQDYLTVNGYLESLEHILCLQDLNPVAYILTEYCVSIFMDEIKSFLKKHTGKDNHRIELSILADGVAIQEII